MFLNILKYPDPFLKTKAEPVASVDASVKKLIEDMIETMYKAKGIGLAATQIGVGKRIVILDVPARNEDGSRAERTPGKHLTVLVNPVLTDAAGSMTYEEGCLSIPGIHADVKRASDITVSALDRDGNRITFRATDLFAIAIQHEVDHLDGILFIDRVSRLKREMIKRRIKKLREAEEWDL